MGSGKGRALLLASRFPFRRIEVIDMLARAAGMNRSSYMVQAAMLGAVRARKKIGRR
jgi:hypothetical protein